MITGEPNPYKAYIKNIEVMKMLELRLGSALLLLVLIAAGPAFGLEAMTTGRKSGAEALKSLASLTDETKRANATRDLEALRIGTSLQFNTGNTNSAIVPSIEGVSIVDSGDFGHSDASYGDWMVDLKVAIKPEPATGTAQDIAQAIRTDIGTVNANFGYLYELFRNDTPLGFEIRGAGQLSYQKTPSTDSSGNSVGSTEFGVFSPEARIGIWLKSLLLGYKYSHNFTFGKDSTVSQELKNTCTHKIVAIMKLTDAGVIAKENQPFYLEMNYTGGRNTINDGTFSVAITKALGWK